VILQAIQKENQGKKNKETSFLSSLLCSSSLSFFLSSDVMCEFKERLSHAFMMFVSFSNSILTIPSLSPPSSAVYPPAPFFLCLIQQFSFFLLAPLF